MGKFITELKVERAGQAWRLLEPLIYEAAAGVSVKVPAGFVSDFASVPRLPGAFMLAGDTAHAAAVIHDWLYSKGGNSRALADAIFREAMEAEGVPWWRRWLMWGAVRTFGGFTRQAA